MTIRRTSCLVDTLVPPISDLLSLQKFTTKVHESSSGVQLIPSTLSISDSLPTAKLFVICWPGSPNRFTTNSEFDSQFQIPQSPDCIDSLDRSNDIRLHFRFHQVRFTINIFDLDDLVDELGSDETSP